MSHVDLNTSGHAAAPTVRRCLVAGAGLGLAWAIVFIPAFLLGLTPFEGDRANLAWMLATLSATSVAAPLISRPPFRHWRLALALAGGALLAAVPLLALGALLMICQMFSC
jgi:hypothetical protein